MTKESLANYQRQWLLTRLQTMPVYRQWPIDPNSFLQTRLAYLRRQEEKAMLRESRESRRNGSMQ